MGIDGISIDGIGVDGIGVDGSGIILSLWRGRRWVDTASWIVAGLAGVISVINWSIWQEGNDRMRRFWWLNKRVVE
jgi:hypothetical protein